MRTWIIAGVFSLLLTSAWAGPNITIPGRYVLSPMLQRVLEPGVKQFYQSELAKALWLLTQAAPVQFRGKPFSWSESGTIDVEFHVAGSFEREYNAQTDEVSKIQVGRLGDNGIFIRQIYFFDRIYSDHNQRPKTSAFIELIATAAYLNFGPVGDYVDNGPAFLDQPLSGRSAQEMRIRGTVAAIEVVEKILAGHLRDGLRPGDIENAPALLSTLKNDLFNLRCQK